MDAGRSVFPVAVLTAVMMTGSSSIASQPEAASEPAGRPTPSISSAQTVTPTEEQLLTALSRHQSPSVRASAAYRLGNAGVASSQAMDLLRSAMQRDPDGKVRQAARRSYNLLAKNYAPSTGTGEVQGIEMDRPLPESELFKAWVKNETAAGHIEPLMDLSFSQEPSVPSATMVDSPVENPVVEPVAMVDEENQPVRMVASQSAEPSNVGFAAPPRAAAPIPVAAPASAPAPVASKAVPVTPAPVSPEPVASPRPSAPVVAPVMEPQNPVVAAEPTSKVEQTAGTEETPTDSQMQPSRPGELSIVDIPRSSEGRKALAQKLLAQGRELLTQGKTDQAQAIVYQLRELAVQYGRFEDNPNKLQTDISRSRSVTTLLYSGIKQL